MARLPMARLCGRMVGPSRACSCVYDMLGPLMVCSRLPMVCLRTYSVLASAYGVFTCGVLAYDMFPSYELAIRSKPLLGGSGIGMRCWSPLRTTIAIQCHGWKSRTGNTFLPLCHEALLRLRHVSGRSVGLAVGEGADAQHRALQRASATSVCSGGRDAYGA